MPVENNAVVYKLESKDKQVFEMSEKAIKQSKTLADLIFNLSYTAEEIEKNEPIPVSNVSGKILQMVINWCEYHKGEPVREDDPDEERNIVLSDWDAQFLRIENDELFDLICAANFLDIQGLLDVSCKSVANMAKGKSPEELRMIFGIPTDEEDEAERAAAERDGTIPSTSGSS